MQLGITRPAVVADGGTTRQFMPGLTVTVAEATAARLRRLQAAVVVDSGDAGSPVEPEAPRRRRKSTDAG
jgi:hypothetical protein